MYRMVWRAGFLVLLLLLLSLPTASPCYLHISDACGYKNTTVLVPVELVDVHNSSITGIEFELAFDEHVISLTGVQNGVLTAQPEWDNPRKRAESGKYVIGVVGTSSKAISNISRGSVLLLNFSVTGSPGEKTWMNISNIKLVNASTFRYNSVAVSQRNGSFSVCAPSTGCLYGTVTYACNGSGVEGADIELKLTDKHSSYKKSTITDSDGGYRFTEVPYGNYTVSVAKEGFLNNSTSLSLASPVITVDTISISSPMKEDLNNGSRPAGSGDIFAKIKTLIHNLFIWQ